MIPRSLDAIVGAAYHQSNSTQLNSNRYVLGQLTAPTRTSLTYDRARAVAVVRALGSPLTARYRGAGARASVGCACARDGPGAYSPARALTCTLADCTRDHTYIAPRYGGCGRVGTALVTLKGRT